MGGGGRCGGAGQLRAVLPVVWHDEIDSTNEEAKRLAAAGLFTECWIAARRQSAGRGRMGRSWASPTGNLFATALIHVPGGAREALRLPFAAALAVHDALAPLAPAADLRLKWPNDVRVDGAKLCGILVEAGARDDESWAAVGIGINVVSVPDAAGQAATSLADLRGDNAVNADTVLGAMRETFAHRRMEARDDFAGTRSAWLDRAEGLGKAMRSTAVDPPVEGVFETLAEDGGLILRLPDGTRRTIRAGDVELVRRV